jgi:hypothetical protein
LFLHLTHYSTEDLEDEVLRWRCCVVQVLLVLCWLQISQLLCATLYVCLSACCFTLECTFFGAWCCANICIYVVIFFLKWNDVLPICSALLY